MTSDTFFQAASVSGSVTALAALRLVQEGKLQFDEDVNLNLKLWKVSENELTQNEKVTLRRLLSHTAGLTVCPLMLRESSQTNQKVHIGGAWPFGAILGLQ